ncbi:hypothetical protein B005_2097 [Nocardiopsis alba ATCC BAA-2165]|uniref:Uncharacterized protein n=1 Tax=Nocardiopsis alba (strain ATCC BAA-2165 / BE74) TaxID=1205910 RepID=J7L624_NOCAA|nr:hypothetical protein B005_2097 [Nocardiopsis alba ATCC BAA-2165]
MAEKRTPPTPRRTTAPERSESAPEKPSHNSLIPDLTCIEFLMEGHLTTAHDPPGRLSGPFRCLHD